ncbi:NAD(P)-binding protein [Auriculariales sp. MPI-PUGE-AT-0066]|nr:NAD(P)-binding protein [Auriculariales sp. MPI-PUGE-AT-0066]
MPPTTLKFSSFAVAGGTGGLGKMIVAELVARGVEVVVLARTAPSKGVPGASVRIIDYESEESIVAALSGIEVVISALADAALGVQPTLAEAAKKASVKLFVPSEFSNRSESMPPDSLFAVKPAMHSLLRSLGLPYTLYYTGYFTDFIFIPEFGFDFASKSFDVVGAGDKLVTFTTRSDIAHFVAYTLTHLTIDKLSNVTLVVTGETRSMVSLKATFEQQFGGEFTILHRDVAEIERKVEEEGLAAAIDYIRLMEEYGWWDLSGKNDNALVPEWKPLTVSETLTKYYAV